MSESPELPLLLPPRSVTDVGTEDQEGWWTHDQMRFYGRACQAPLLAEIERLKGEIDKRRENQQKVVDAMYSAERERDELRAKLEVAQKEIAGFLAVRSSIPPSPPALLPCTCAGYRRGSLSGGYQCPFHGQIW